MKERSAKIDNDQDMVDFWSQLNSYYEDCMKLNTGLSENVSGLPLMQYADR